MTFEKLLALVIETERGLPEDAADDESRYGDTLARRAVLRGELDRRIAALRNLDPMCSVLVGRIMDGRNRA